MAIRPISFLFALFHVFILHGYEQSNSTPSRITDHTPFTNTQMKNSKFVLKPIKFSLVIQNTYLFIMKSRVKMFFIVEL